MIIPGFPSEPIILFDSFERFKNQLVRLREAGFKNRIGFVQISNIIEESLNKLNTNEPTCLADLLELDTVIRSTASQSIALLGH